MTIHEINDDRLKAYLSGRMGLEELRRSWSTVCPWEITEKGEIRVIDLEEYESRIWARLTERFKKEHGELPPRAEVVPCWWMKDLGKPASGCRCHGNLAMCLNPDRKDRNCITSNCRPDRCEIYKSSLEMKGV
jgi:hypothetical protein